MKVINCFEVMGNTDTTEGRGPMKVVARFSNREAAIEYVRSKAYSRWCVMGVQNFKYDQSNIYEKRMTIMDTVDEIDISENEEIRQAALSKLSDKEKQVLGLIGKE